jgi:hypothetical protein
VAKKDLRDAVEIYMRMVKQLQMEKQLQSGSLGISS